MAGALFRASGRAGGTTLKLTFVLLWQSWEAKVVLDVCLWAIPDRVAVRWAHRAESSSGRSAGTTHFGHFGWSGLSLDLGGLIFDLVQALTKCSLRSLGAR